MFNFHLIGRVPVDTGHCGPDGGCLPHHVVHDVEVSLGCVYGQLTNIRQVVVPLLHSHSIHLSYEHSAEHGTNALDDALLSIHRLFLYPVLGPVLIDQVVHPVVDLLLHIEVPVFSSKCELFSLNCLCEVCRAMNAYTPCTTSLSPTDL